MVQPVVLLLLLSMLPLFDATQCSRGGYCPVGLDCNRNDSLCEYPQMCSVGANRTDYDQGFTCSSSLPVCKPLQEDMVIIQNFHDPLVIGAACAAVSQITAKSVFAYKSVLVTITNGTRQVGNGVKFDLMIVVALSTTCKKDSELCTSVECPVYKSTQQLWMVSIVAPPSLTTQTVKYDVLSIRQVMHIGSGIVKEIDERDFFLCSICETIVAYLESHLDKKISRRAVKEMLNNACNKLIFQKSCLDFVNKYFDKIWNAVIHKTLGKLCCDIQFCTCKNDDATKGPMYPAASHGDLCPEGFFCLTGDDCSSNSNLCEVGVCQRPTEENCIQGITVQFSLNKYEVKENGEPAQLVLILSKPLEYCSSSIQIKVEDGTATGGVDYQFPRGGFTQVIVSGGADRVSFNITINDDNILERTENFRLSIVDVSLPCGVIVGSRQSAEVVIFDDDRTCVKIDHQAYSVGEGLILQVTLSLSLRASYDIGVTVRGVDRNAKKYDYDPGPYRVTFRAGNTRASLRINITDDDIYEEAETFNFYISTFLPSQVFRCEPYRSTVTILDDEQTIRAGFDPSTYMVEEDVGTFSPVLTLNTPSPCCITVFAELMDDTATGGGVDYDYSLPIMYEFTFLAGETCATPVDPIPITDDRISERDERFRITIIKLSLPLGVQTSRDSATINIKDNDIACSFERETYEIDENDGPLKLRLRLDKSPPKEFNLQVHDLNNTANAGEDYTPGPYLVTFRKNSQISNEFSVSINEDGIYTGNKDFNLTIVDDLLPFGLVPGDIISVKVTIVDNECLPFSINISATVLTPHSVEVIWTLSSSPDVTGYLILYTTTASYTSGGRVTVNSGSTIILTSLEENTLYTITVQAITCDNTTSTNSNEVSVTTYTDVPSSPPWDVMVTSINPGSLMVSWQSPPMIDHNGLITSYVIQYTRDGSSDMMNINVNSGTTNNISGLVAYVDYSVIVAAVNVNGTGPFSDPTVGWSGEDDQCKFSQEIYEVDEGGEICLKLTFIKSLSEDVQIMLDYNITSTHLSLQKDFQILPPDFVTLFAGETVVSIPIRTKADSVLENNESLYIVAFPPSEDKHNCRTTVTILDNNVRFNPSNYSVDEDTGSVLLTLTLDKPLSVKMLVKVDFKYNHGTTPGERYITFFPGEMKITFEIKIEDDDTLEYDEIFDVTANASHNAIATVTIKDDDTVTVEFQATKYPPPPNNNKLLKPVLKLSNPVAYTIQVTLQGENGTAKSGEDYIIQNRDPIIVNPDTLNREIFIDTVDDDVVETLIEEFYIDISYVANENGGVNDDLEIGKNSRTTLQIKDEDECFVIIIEQRLTFSKPMYRNASIEIQHIKGPPFHDWLLAGDTNYIFDAAVANIVKIKVCIPKDLFDERPRRVKSYNNNKKVEICSLVD